MSDIVAVVTIEGSVTPSAHLARGERRTVRMTDRVQGLIDRGYVVVVESTVDDHVAQAKVELDGVTAQILHAVPDIEPAPEPVADERPRRSRARSVTVEQTDEAPPAPDAE